MTNITRRRAPGDLVFLAAAIIAAIIIAHIVLVLIGANPANDIAHTLADWSGWLATWFDDLFEPTNEKLEIFINFGLAALFFLVIGGVLRTAIDRA